MLPVAAMKSNVMGMRGVDESDATYQSCRINTSKGIEKGIELGSLMVGGCGIVERVIGGGARLASIQVTKMIKLSIRAQKYENKLLAEKIAGGHAYEKHVLSRNEFPGFSRPDFEQHIRNILDNPSEMKALTHGRTAYWDEKSGTFIIRDPLRQDGGTAFRPDLNRKYYDDHLE